MIGWLAAATVFAFGPPQDADAPGAVPPMEIHLRQADAVDLLFVLASVHNSPMLVVRPATDVRITYQHEHILPIALRTRLGGELDMRGTRAGDFEAWVPACAKPEYRPIDFPDAKRLTMSFGNIPVGALLQLIADAEGLEFSAPEGYPDVGMAVYFVNRTTEEVASVVSGALDVQFRVVGGKLEVRPAKVPAKCSAAQYKWIKEEEASPPAEGAPLPQYFSQKNCGRVTKIPASVATRCEWYETFPLSNFQIRGYLKLSPHGARLAYIEPPDQGTPPLLALEGDRFSEDFVAVTEVQEDSVLLAQYDQREGAKRTVKRALTATYIDGTIQDRKATSDDDRERESYYFERYGLEDLQVVSTEKDNDRWIAVLRTVHGVTGKVTVGSYVGPHWGAISSIDANGIDVMELVQDPAHAWYESPVRLQKGTWFQRPRDIERRRLAFPELHTQVQSQLLDATERGDIAAMASAIEQGAEINSTYGKYTALFVATAYRRADGTDAVRWLLQRGARADGLFSKYESTPLTEAVERGNLEMTKMLLEAGASPDLADKRRCTPLYYAAQNGDVGIATLLLAHRADPRVPNEIGLTPFLISAYHGHAEMVKVFMNAGVAHGDADRNGQTMLNAAVQGRQLELVRTLIGLGADVNARDRWGKTILDAAVERDAAQIVELLLSEGAKTASAAGQASGK